MVLAIVFGLAIGASLGMLGGGGGVLAVPVLVYVFGEEVHPATTASLAIVAAGALAGTLGQARRRHVCWRHAAAFTPPGVVGASLGTAANRSVGGGLLLALFALAMLAAAWATWHKAGRRNEELGEATPACPPLQSGRVAGAGLIVGTMIGFFGVGGGFVVVPTLAVGLRFPIRWAIGTSLAIVAATSLASFAIHLLSGNAPEPGITAGLAGAAAVGAVLGDTLAQRVPQQLLGKAFALLLVGVAAYLLAASLFLGGPPS